MTSPQGEPAKLLRELSDALNLPCEPQDWGIVNADGARLPEFIACFEQRPLAATQRFQMAELILASANDRLEANLELDIEALLDLAVRHESAFAHHVAYWLSLPATPEFPLAALLRSHLRT